MMEYTIYLTKMVQKFYHLIDIKINSLKDSLTILNTNYIINKYNDLVLQQQLFNNNINILYSGFTGYYTFKFKDNNDNIIKLLPVTIKEITIDVLC